VLGHGEANDLDNEGSSEAFVLNKITGDLGKLSTLMSHGIFLLLHAVLANGRVKETAAAAAAAAAELYKLLVTEK
jgi:hypothetical protein